jgi:uncharacterized membrane protein YdbT with pleckstrin-like domain
MGYIEDNLLPDEIIIAKAKIHWAIFIYPIFIFVFGLLLVPIIRITPEPGLTYSAFALFIMIFITWIIPALGLFVLIVACFSYITTEFALTDRRIIAKVGILNQHSIEVMINKIESIRVSQPILGRILNYGTIIVIGSGGTHQRFKNISQPMQLRQKINLLISKIKQ